LPPSFFVCTCKRPPVSRYVTKMKKIVFSLLIALAFGAIGFWLGMEKTSLKPGVETVSAHPDTLLAGKTAYVCPMHSHIVQDHPGTCPICGMDLVVLKEAPGALANQIYVDTATQQKLGVQLVSAELATLTHDISTYGTLVPDEGAVLRITPNVDGLLTRLHVNKAGQRIARGQVLYEISSQEVLDLQYEYVDILYRGEPTRKMAEERRAQNRENLANARNLEPSARELVERGVRQSEEQLWSLLQPLERDRERVELRLQQIGFTDGMLAKLAKSQKALRVVPVRAQRDCVVQEVMARPGMTVGRMTEILHCVDPTHALIEIALYPNQLSWAEEGDAVTMEFAGGETVKAQLSGLNPLVDEATRTLRVRMPVALKREPILGEYATVTIHATPRRVVSVPKSAVMRTGRGNFVMRALGKGHFMPAKVITGIETGERIAIRDGLEAGDQVAVNGQFLMDAAASIADTTQRMRANHAPAP
jgi:Cu(I)/Ag(I) efflux system membrane fusion protein